MGYSHYINRKRELNKEQFSALAKDLHRIYGYVENELGIKLANGISDLDSQPEADENSIWFNGSDQQPVGVWTTGEEVSIPWPDNNASINDTITDPIQTKVSGHWEAGTLLSQRTSPVSNNSGLGSGSYESFSIPRVYEPQKWEEQPKNGLYLESCKTGYRPYDIAVTAVMLALKHYFPNDVFLTTDGEPKDWFDGRMICFNLLGYGINTDVDFH